MHRTRLWLLVWFSAFLLVSCGGGTQSSTSTPSSPSSPPPSVAVAAGTTTVNAGASLQLTATVTGITNPTLVWSVNSISNGNSTVGTIASTGILTATYTAPTTIPTPNTVTIEAALSSNSAVNGTVVFMLNANLSPAAAARFLEQTTFGPTPQLITQVQQSGLQAFLTSQFALPVTTYADAAASETNDGPLEQRFYVQQLTAPDQLRQRVAFALSQIFVISSNKVFLPQAFTPYLNLLATDAFTNYRQIMQDVTLSPAMGDYLDMVNNDKPNTTAGTHADENYARELMQLFTIGLSELNEDGSLQLDSNNNPIPTYTQNTVEAFADAYTGWTYPTMPGATLQKHNPAYWTGPMVAFESNHDTTDPKQLLQYTGVANGGLLPTNQTAEQDLAGALDNIFNHPNVPPFVALRLIQHLVTSNPSPAYIQRVADVFKNNGSGVRGDMTAVITAVLLDPEARRGDSPTTANNLDGYLQEPILFITGVLRAFGATSDGVALVGQGTNMGQTALTPASVFNFYSPFYVIPGTTQVGPEFQLLTTATALARANFVNTFVFGSLGTGTTVDFSSYVPQASNLSTMVDSLSALMMHGSMSAATKSSILTALQAVPAGSSQALTQVKTAIYLIATSSQYQVRH